jgi:hypothetical protein
MRPSFWDYVREAFNARPIGMFIPPNWVALAAAGLFAFVQPNAVATGGVLAIGTALELAYLTLLATHPRFQRFVAGKMTVSSTGDAMRRAEALLASLPDVDKRRYGTLRQRCLSVLDQQFHGDANAPGYLSQSDSLGRLTWTYLRLLATRQAILHVVREPPRPGEPPPLPGAQATARLEARLAEVRQRLADPALRDELRHSLTGQVELLEQRLARRIEADQKLAFLDAETARIEEQVELIREQAVLSTDPEHFSRRIDEIGATLGSTGQWISEQQQALGAMDDLISEPPPLTAQGRARESN